MKKSFPATTVATINNQKIVIIENGEKRVAVKPICEALGVSVQGQLEKLKTDPILNSTIKVSFTVGADGKDREMQTIPFKYVFGWLFRIDSRNVKPESRDTVLKYQVECYDALYQHFIEMDEYMKFRTNEAEKIWDQVEDAREGFKLAKNKLEALKKSFATTRAMTIEDFRLMKSQTKMEFPENETNEKGADDV